MARSAAVAAVVVLAWLTVGVLGYHFIAELAWIDALLNASMIMSGMGPVHPLRADGAKLFASAYAITSGVMFLSTWAILVAPVLHRLMHRFHAKHEGTPGAVERTEQS